MDNTALTLTTGYNFIYPSTCNVVDIDECAENNGGCSLIATCTNIPGSLTCTCLPGYTGDGYNCTGKPSLKLCSLDKGPDDT